MAILVYDHHELTDELVAVFIGLERNGLRQQGGKEFRKWSFQEASIFIVTGPASSLLQSIGTRKYIAHHPSMTLVKKQVRRDEDDWEIMGSKLNDAKKVPTIVMIPLEGFPIQTERRGLLR